MTMMIMKTRILILLMALLAMLALPEAQAQNAVKPQQFAVVNASTTVPVQLTNNTQITANTITVIGKASAQGSANVGSVYIGTSSADGANSFEILSGQIYNFTAPRGQSFRLSDFYIDVTSANDGVCIIYQ